MISQVSRKIPSLIHLLINNRSQSRWQKLINVSSGLRQLVFSIVRRFSPVSSKKLESRRLLNYARSFSCKIMIRLKVRRNRALKAILRLFPKQKRRRAPNPKFISEKNHQSHMNQNHRPNFKK